MEGWVKEWMERWVNEGMDGQMDWWAGGWVYKLINDELVGEWINKKFSWKIILLEIG